MTYRRAFLFFILIQLLFFAPMILTGKVISPVTNDKEIMAPAVTVEENTNHKFTDYTKQFIPELKEQITNNSSSWISLWNPHVEFGRPTFQGQGLTKAYPLTYFLTLFISNPFVLYTAFIILLVNLAGMFFFMFLRELELHPLVCLVSAAGFSLGPFVSYWLTFAVFIAPITWTACLLWLITRFFKKRSVSGCLGISFATYSLFMLGYPQSILIESYTIVLYTFYLAWKLPGSIKTKLIYVGQLALLGLSGLVMASPYLLDLLSLAGDSVRLSVTDDFFLAVLPKQWNLQQLSNYFLTVFDPFWLGNPISEDYPITYNGFSFTPFFSCLLFLSFFRGQWKRLWLWQAIFLFWLLEILNHSVYLFVVRHLGLGLSRSTLQEASIIPGFIIASYVLDNLVRDRMQYGRKLIFVLAVPLFGLALIVNTYYNSRVSDNLLFICLSIIVVGLTIYFVGSGKQWLLYPIISLSVLIYGQSLILALPVSKISIESKLTNALNSELSDGVRFAKIGHDITRIIPSNQEVFFKLPSIHTYNSLSSKYYQSELLKLSSRGATTFGRHFDYISSDDKLGEPAFSFTGVGVVLSFEDLQNPALIKSTVISGLKLYKMKKPPIMWAQINKYAKRAGQTAEVNESLHDVGKLNTRLVKNYDDRKVFSVTPANQETLLFLSQQFNDKWYADSKGQNLTTVRVNGFYQGVIIPPNTREVVLKFKPYIWWAWIPEIIYLAFAILLLIKNFYKLFKSRKLSYAL